MRYSINAVNQIGEKIDLDVFYNLRINQDSITLQGKNNLRTLDHIIQETDLTPADFKLSDTLHLIAELKYKDLDGDFWTVRIVLT